LEQKPEPPIVAFARAHEWEEWLAGHFDEQQGAWLRFYKKGSGVATVSYDEALDVALCYGWIDGLVNKYDDKSYLQRFVPRRAKSKWSKRNTEHVARLTAEGRMRPPGLAAVEAAKKDGRWDAAYESPSNVTVPDDFQAALDAKPAAKAAFETIDRTNRYAILYRITQVKKPETRAANIRKFVEMLVRGEKIHS